MPDAGKLALAALILCAAVVACSLAVAPAAAQLDAAPAGVATLLTLGAGEPERHAGIVDHFKFGSIGAERRAGIPYYIWAVMPKVFPDYLPNRPGDGYARFGLIFESPSGKRPIGTSLRNAQVELVGLNCAVCHTGTLRDAPGAPRRNPCAGRCRSRMCVPRGRCDPGLIS
jgi:hypothetical protein